MRIHTNKYTHMLFRSLFVLCLAGAVWSACNKPTPFGADLLEDQKADFAFTDTFTLQFYLEREDSVQTSDPTSVASFMFCGHLDDPYFGKATSDIYTQLKLSGLNPDFSNAELDSVILYLSYSASGVYGDTLIPQTFEVHRLLDTVFDRRAYFSNQNMRTGDQVGLLSGYMPQPRTRATLLDSTGPQAAYLRIPLSQSFGEEIMGLDSLSLASDSLFGSALRGLRLRTKAASAPGAMLAFDLNNANFSFVRLYFTKDDTLSRTFDLFFRGTNKFEGYSHDYSGTPVEGLIGQPLQDRLYLQGISGLRVKTVIPYANVPEQVVVNKAELRFTIEPLPGDFDALKPAAQLVLTRPATDGTLVLTPDVAYALSFDSPLPGLLDFGGYPKPEMVQDNPVEQYQMLLSAHFQNMIRDTSTVDLSRRTLYLSVYTQRSSAMRSALYGPSSGIYAPKLLLKYTRLPN